jgi:hypothetical protein
MLRGKALWQTNYSCHQIKILSACQQSNFRAAKPVADPTQLNPASTVCSACHQLIYTGSSSFSSNKNTAQLTIDNPESI